MININQTHTRNEMKLHFLKGGMDGEIDFSGRMEKCWNRFTFLCDFSRGEIIFGEVLGGGFGLFGLGDLLTYQIFNCFFFFRLDDKLSYLLFERSGNRRIGLCVLRMGVALRYL